MSEGRAWMPLYVADYLADTRHLSTTEHGAYLLLIMHAWTNNGQLPLDETRLARIAGLSSREWSASREIILQFFGMQEDGYRHKRIDAELSRTDEIIEKRRRAGKASAASRRQRSANTCSTHVGTHASTPAPTHGQQTARPSQSPYVSASANAAADTAQEPQRQHSPALSRKPISPDWQPSPEDLAFVAMNTPGSAWPPEKITRITHEFVAHYRSRGNLSADWSADFRRWILRQPRFERAHESPSPAGFSDPILRAVEAEMGA